MRNINDYSTNWVFADDLEHILINGKVVNIYEDNNGSYVIIDNDKYYVDFDF